MSRVSVLLVTADMSIHQVMEVIERSGLGIALLVGPHGRLITTITDGDIRRAILRDFELDQSAMDIVELKRSQNRLQPVTIREGASADEMLALLKEKQIRLLPVINGDGCVVELAVFDELVAGPRTDVQAVVMAGGLGKRLRPLTLDTPKPMLPVRGKPILEWIVHQLKDAGINRLNISTHYLREKIVDHFQTGESFGVEIDYLNEDEPRGTAGALSMIDRPRGPFLVMNGDILTQLDFKALMAFHAEHEADVTTCVRKYHFQIPYGVVQCEDWRLTGIDEKPQMNFFVNAGIYLLEPHMLDLVPNHQPCDMPDLLRDAMEAGMTVATFPVIEEWIDIGRPEDYERVNAT